MTAQKKWGYRTEGTIEYSLTTHLVTHALFRSLPFFLESLHGAVLFHSTDSMHLPKFLFDIWRMTLYHPGTPFCNLSRWDLCNDGGHARCNRLTTETQGTLSSSQKNLVQDGWWSTRALLSVFVVVVSFTDKICGHPPVWCVEAAFRQWVAEAFQEMWEVRQKMKASFWICRMLHLARDIIRSSLNAHYCPHSTVPRGSVTCHEIHKDTGNNHATVTGQAGILGRSKGTQVYEASQFPVSTERCFDSFISSNKRPPWHLKLSIVLVFSFNASSIFLLKPNPPL